MSKQTEPKTPCRWIRVNTDWDDSTWLADLPWDVRACWLVVLCHVKVNGIGGICKEPNVKRMAASKDVPVTALRAVIKAAVDHGALRTLEGRWEVVKWREYQKDDMTNAERQKRHRELKKEQSNAPVTALRNGITDETKTLTKTETKTKTETTGLFEELFEYFGDKDVTIQFMDQCAKADWKDAKGMPIKDIKAYAKAWKPKDTKPQEKLSDGYRWVQASDYEDGPRP